MPDTKSFNSMVKNLYSQVESLAGLTVRNYKKDALRDGKKMIVRMKKDLRRWADLLEQDLLTTADFEWLVSAQASEAKMTALERSGLALARADHFKRSVVNLVIDQTFDFVIGDV